MENSKRFIEYVIKSIVDHPSDVQITSQTDEMGVLLSLQVHQDDMRTVIGVKGQNLQLLRSLLRMVGFKEKARVNLRLLESDGTFRQKEYNGN